MVMGLVGFLLFFVLAIQDLALLKDTTQVPGDCRLPSTVSLLAGQTVPLFDSQSSLDLTNAYAYSQTARKALECTNDSLYHIDAACTLSELYVSIPSPPPTLLHSKTLLSLMLALSIFFIISGVICSIVFSGFKFFSNIPMESLDVDATSCKVSVLGTACRYGPWAVRALTVIILSLVVALTALPVAGNYCLGTVEKTHACVHMYDDCGLNQFKNCRFYYSSNCVGTGLPHAGVQTSLFEQCKDPSFASKFSGRIDARLVYPTVCTRCWALHSDCKNPATNRMRLTTDKTSDEFVYESTRAESPAISVDDLEIGRDLYCRCVEGIDKVGTATGDEKSLFFDPIKLTRNNTDCTSIVATSACPAQLASAVVNPPFDANASIWSEFWSDSAVGTNSTQECSWGPKGTSAYFYESTECDQGGSTVNRYVFIVGYVTITLIVLMIVAGFSVRFTVQPETWSYSPQQKNEPWYWRVLRQLGPG